MVIFVVSLFVSYELRFDFLVPKNHQTARIDFLLLIVPFKLLVFWSFGQFGGMLSYFRLQNLYRIFSALAVASAILIFIWLFSSGYSSPPRSVILADFVFSFVFVCGFRLSLRVIRERYLSGESAAPHEIENVAIVGAGDVGETIASDLLSKRGFGMRPVIFLDDDETKWNLNLHGIKVINGIDRLGAIQRKYGIEKIIIAMPSAPVWRVKEIIIAAQQANLKAEIIPSLAQLTTGTVRANRLRPVEVEDLLGREPVKLDSDNI